MSTLTEKEYWAKIDQLKAKYPDYCEAADVEVLNLIMKREFAEAILRGEKKVEFRAVSDHYIKRLIDRKVVEFKKRHEDDPDVQEFCDPLRIVRRIHFHNYNNSWFLDVDVLESDYVAADEEGVKFLHDRYDCHELDETYESLPAKERDKLAPTFFFFVIDKVVATNL